MWVGFGECMVRLAIGRGRPAVSHGGSESNVAVALAGLGRRARWVSVVPATPTGDALRADLEQSGIEVSAVPGVGEVSHYHVAGKAGSPVYRRGRSAFALLEPAAFDWSALLAGASALHLTGITPLLGDGPRAAWAAAWDAAGVLRVPIVLDLNHRPALSGLDELWTLVVDRAAELALLLVGWRSLAHLSGASAAGPDRLAELARAIGCPVAVAERAPAADGSVTRTGRLALPDGRSLTARGLVHRPVEPLGGGDAWLAGLADGWLDHASPSLPPLASLSDAEISGLLTRADHMAALAQATVGDHAHVARADLEASLRQHS